MLGLAARLIGGMFAPLIDQASASTARLLRKLALFLAAGVAMLVVLIALTIAFDLWIASKAGPIIGALAVAGLYLVLAIVALVLALRPAPKTGASADKSVGNTSAGAGAGPTSSEKEGLDSQVDDFTAPLLTILRNLGFRKEQLAVLAGASVAKQIGAIPLVGLAIVAGFLLGRMSGGVRELLSSDLLDRLMASDLLASLFGAKPKAPDAPEAEDNERDAA